MFAGRRTLAVWSPAYCWGGRSSINLRKSPGCCGSRCGKRWPACRGKVSRAWFGGPSTLRMEVVCCLFCSGIVCHRDCCTIVMKASRRKGIAWGSCGIRKPMGQRACRSAYCVHQLHVLVVAEQSNFKPQMLFFSLANYCIIMCFLLSYHMSSGAIRAFPSRPSRKSLRSPGMVARPLLHVNVVARCCVRLL